MKVNPEDEKAGMRWLFGAGAFALLVSFGLMRIDDYLSNSKSQQKLGATLHELRLAQTSLSSSVTDDRQTQDSLYKGE